MTSTRTPESAVQDAVDKSRPIPADSRHPAHAPGEANLKLKGKDKFRKIATYTLIRASEKNLTQVASSLTFTTVLAVVPLLAVILSLFTAFPLFDDFRLALEDFLVSNLMPVAVSDNVMSYLNEFAAKASGLTAIGGLALIVTSVMLMRTIDEAFNNIWQVQKQRPLRHRILVYWAILSLGPIILGASLWAMSIFTRESLGYMGEATGLLNIAFSFIPLLITSLGFTALFMFVPNQRVELRDALIGGVGTAISLEIMRIGFAYYLARFPSYTIIYGAFATVPIFLLWIYMSWLAILGGATVAATLPALRRQHWARQHYLGVEFVDAVNAINALWESQGRRDPGLTLNAMADILSADHDELKDALETLADLGYVVKTQDKQASRWVLACDPRTATLGPLVDALLVGRTQPHISHVPMLLKAVALTLLNKPVLLSQLFEKPESLSESTEMVQNTTLRSPSASGNTKETDHAQSQ